MIRWLCSGRSRTTCRNDGCRPVAPPPADPESLRFATRLATFVVKNLAQADRLAEAFRRGGRVPFAAYREQFIAEGDRAGAPGYRAHLVKDWLGAMPGAVERLTAGDSFLDFGCGGGVACIEVARAFPRARLLGLDRHGPSIDRARAAPRQAGVEDRARFDTTPLGDLPSDMRFDVVTSFDVVHDLADPVGVLRAIRERLAPGGGYRMVEAKVSIAWRRTSAWWAGSCMATASFTA